MARDYKRGLDYFPLDVDIFSDPKIEYLEALHGHVGFSIFMKLLCKIYRNGYYLPWSEKDSLIFSKRYNCEHDVVINVVKCCINDGLFNHKLYKMYSLLTSRPIQKRYFKAVERRAKVDVILMYTLIDINVYIKKQNVNIIEVNGNKSTQSKVKKSKEEKSKEKKEEIKKKFLDFVFLGQDQIKSLQKEFGEIGANERIENLNNYIHTIGEKKAKARYKSHYHVILNWEKKNETQPNNNSSKRYSKVCNFQDPNITEGAVEL